MWSKKDSLRERLARKSVRRESGCIEWIGSAQKGTGYCILRFGGERMYAHRAAWIAHKGKIPEGLFVLHKCDNKRCINPKHLFVGTQLDNMHDMIRKGRKVLPRGEGHGCAVLSEGAVLLVRAAWANGAKQKDLAEIFKVSKQTINLIVHRKTWAHL